MSKQKLTIIAVNIRSGIAQKTGRQYTIHEAQCILEQSVEGLPKVEVGVINLSKELAELGPGDYLAEFALAQGGGQDSGKLVPRIVSLVPHGNSRPQPRAESKAA